MLDRPTARNIHDNGLKSGRTVFVRSGITSLKAYLQPVYIPHMDRPSQHIGEGIG